MSETATEERVVDQVDEVELLRESYRESRRQQNQKMSELLREAIEAAVRPEGPDERPINAIVGLIDPKPMEEWGAREYAKAIVSLQNVEGTEQKRNAMNVQRYLQEKADQHGIDQQDLISEEQNQAEGIAARSLSDFAEKLFMSIQLMDESQQRRAEADLRTLPAEMQSSVQEVLNRAEHMMRLQLQAQQVANRPRPQNDRPPEDPIDAGARALYEEEQRRKQERMRKLMQLPEQRRANYQDQQEENAIRQWAAEKRLYEEVDEDWEFYNGYIDESIKKRLDRIVNDPQHEDEDKKRKYFADLQKWVSIVLQNDERSGGGGKLVLKNERYAEFQKIVSKSFNDFTMDEIKNFAQYLSGEGQLDRYFIQKDGTKNERVNDAIGYKTEADLPSIPNFEETMDLIQRQYGSKFATGGEFELIDIRGEFHFENFAYWMRERTNWLREQNPAGGINPLSDVTVRTLYSAIPLAEILQSPQFRKKRQFDIRGNEYKEATDEREKIGGHWGREMDHPQLTEDMALDQLYELAFYSQDHSNAAKYQEKRGDRNGFLEVQQTHLNAWISRGNWTTIFKRPSRRDGTGIEFDEYHNGGKDGTMGRAMREMVVAYANMVEFTEFFTYQEGDRRFKLQDGVTREEGKRKHFEDNLFYKYLEADGANAFLLALSSESLKENDQAVGKYQEFICERLGAAKDKYLTRSGLTDDQKLLLDQLFESSQARVRRNGKIDTALDSSKDLEFFHSQVEKLVFGKKAATIDKDAIAQDVQKDIVKNLKSGLFSKLIEIRVPKINSKTGRQEGMMYLGELAFDVHDDDAKDKKKKMTVAEAFDQFDDDYDKFEKFVDYRRQKNAIGGPIGKPDTKSEEFEKYVERNERLACVLSEALANFSRKELNYFRKSDYFFSKTLLFDKALMKGIAGKAFGLDDVESTFLGGWAKNMLFTFGIAGQNDTTATGFDYWTRILNTADYLAAQETKAYPVVETFIKEVKFLGTNMFDMLMVRHPGETEPKETLLDVFSGGVGDDIRSRDDRILGPDKHYIIGSNAQQNVFLNNFRNASELLDHLRSGEFHWEGITKTDIYGNVIIDKDKVLKEFTKLWTNIRYSTDQHGMDYSRLMSRYGKIDDVMHQQFGKHTRSLLDYMQETMYTQHDPSKKKEEQSGVMDMWKKPGIGVFSALVGSILEEHRGTTFEKRWTIQQINEMEYLLGAIVHKDHKVKKFNTRLPRHIWDAILVTHGIGFKKMMAQEGGYAVGEALWFALVGLFNDFTNEIGKARK